MIQTQATSHIRGHCARSIDFDVYRKRATALRAEAKRAPRLRKLVSIVLSILCAGAVFLVVAGAARTSGDRATITHAEAFQASENVDHQTIPAGSSAPGGGSGPTVSAKAGAPSRRTTRSRNPLLFADRLSAAETAQVRRV